MQVPAPDSRQHRAGRRLRAVAEEVPTYIRRTMRRVVARTGSIAAAAQQGEGHSDEEEGGHPKDSPANTIYLKAIQKKSKKC